MRRMPDEWFEPAAWNSAGLKKTASPLVRGAHVVVDEVGLELGRW